MQKREGSNQETVQIFPRIPASLKAQIDAECTQRKVQIGEIVTTALQQYFAEAEERQQQLDVMQQQLAQVLYALNQLTASVAPPAGGADTQEATEGLDAHGWTENGRVVPETHPRKRAWWRV